MRGCEGADELVLRTTEVPLQPGDRPASALRENHQIVALCLCEIATIYTVLQVILAFRQRCAGDIEKAAEIGVGASSESFSDVSWTRSRGVTNLFVVLEIALDCRTF